MHKATNQCVDRHVARATFNDQMALYCADQDDQDAHRSKITSVVCSEAPAHTDNLASLVYKLLLTKFREVSDHSNVLEKCRETSRYFYENLHKIAIAARIAI